LLYEKLNYSFYFLGLIVDIAYKSCMHSILLAQAEKLKNW